jgi:23S rRNA (adenine2503-C2)-methyltransferase
MSSDATNLLDLTPEELREALGSHFSEREQPAYRSGQVARWMYQEGAVGFHDMTDLPLAEREALQSAFTLAEPLPDTLSVSADGTAKHLWKLSDGELVESVLIPSWKRLTLCISSQAGCPLGCTFCATGWSGFRRNLTPGEIVAQFRASRRWAEEKGMGRITNIVYMGMGEPLANRDAVFPSLTILNQGYEFGARRITVSTVGIVPGIQELSRRTEQYRLAISLHAPESELRAKLIPVEKRYPLPVLMEALRAFNAAGGKRITFEYTMIRDVNDDPSLAPKLAELALDVDAFVNLIPFNPIPYQDWRASTKERVQVFKEVLERRGVSAEEREPRGRDIDAACGQLRAGALARTASDEDTPG